MAAATDLRRPLLPSSAGSHPTHTISDQTPPPQHIITIKDHVGFPQSGTPTNQDSIFLPTQFRFDADLTRNQENPYGVLGSDGFEAPRSTTVDPFRNQTPKIEGVYEWVKMLVCVPIVLVRLVLFGLCLLVLVPPDSHHRTTQQTPLQLGFRRRSILWHPLPVSNHGLRVQPCMSFKKDDDEKGKASTRKFRLDDNWEVWRCKGSGRGWKMGGEV